MRRRGILLQHYFDIQWDKVIGRYQFYQQLLERQGKVTEPEEVEKALEKFAIQDYLDLQVWFNLVRIDPEIRHNNAFLTGLINKGRNFSESEKEELMRQQLAIMEKLSPCTAACSKKGRSRLLRLPIIIL